MSARSSRFMLAYSLIAAAALFVAANLIAGMALGGWRLDLTQNRLFTVSKGTKHTLAAIDEPLHLRLFYSAQAANGYPEVQSYAERVKGLLKRYQALSHGKLTLDIIDPKPYTEEEDQAVSLGMQGVPVDQSGSKLFFGLAVTNATDETLGIPFFDPSRQNFLEYDITRLIDRLKTTKPVTLGVMSWLPMRGTPEGYLEGKGPWAIFQQFQQFFNVAVLETSATEIPANIDVLLVAHPATASAETLYAIDQFVLRGGKLILMLDPHVEIASLAEKTSSAKPLLDAWGIAMSEGIAADPDLAISVTTKADVTSLGVAPNVTWLQLRKDDFNQGEVATADLKTMRIATAAAFEPKKDASLSLIPLLTTGDDAFTVSPLRLMFAEQDPTLLMKDMTPSDHRLVLAARLTGKARSAYPNHPGGLKESAGPVNIVLIGDTDFLRDGFWVQKQQILGNMMFSPTADNGNFMLNLVDFLSGDPALIALRSRTSADRDFTVVKKIKAEAEAQFRSEEEALRGKLNTLEQNLQSMQGDEKTAAMLAPQQQEQLNQFRAQMLETRKQLRNVRHALDQRIDRLGGWLKAINIGLMPLLVLLLAGLLPRRLGMKRR